MRDLDGLEPHVLKLLCFHPGMRPLDGSFQCRRATQPVAYIGREVRDFLPAFHILKRGTENPAGGLSIAVGEWFFALGQ